MDGTHRTEDELKHNEGNDGKEGACGYYEPGDSVVEQTPNQTYSRFEFRTFGDPRQLRISKFGLGRSIHVRHLEAKKLVEQITGPTLASGKAKSPRS